MATVLITMPFTDAQIDRLRRISPRLSVSRVDARTAEYRAVEVLYTGNPPGDLTRAPKLRWIQLHMAGVNTLHDHPVYADRTIQLTTTSGVHAATVAEYAITMMLALAHRVPAMVAWKEPPTHGHPLYAVDNAIVSPHVSGFLSSYDDRCLELFAENLRRWLDDAPLLNVVDRARGY